MSGGVGHNVPGQVLQLHASGPTLPDRPRLEPQTVDPQPSMFNGIPTVILKTIRETAKIIRQMIIRLVIIKIYID